MTISTPQIEKNVEKAINRAGLLDTDLGSLAKRVRDAVPVEINSSRETRDRREFLESLYSEKKEADAAFERIINGNELQDASFLPRGALVTRAVMRVVLHGSGGVVRGYGSGFLIGDGMLLTNNHVLPNRDIAMTAIAEAFYERDLYGVDIEPQRYALEPDHLFYTSESLDFTVVAVAGTAVSGKHGLSALGWLPLIGGVGKATEGEWLSIVQHPQGGRKQLCVRENQLIKRDTDVLWYSTDTLGGSSGSPVFNNDWLVVALHHSGVPEIVNGRWQTIDGRDWDRNRDREDSIKWIANEGIRVSRIVETLRSDASIADHPIVRAATRYAIGDIQGRLPVIYPAGTAALNAVGLPATLTTLQPVAPIERNAAVTKRRINVTLEIDENGAVSVVNGGDGGERFQLADDREARRPKLEIDAPVVPEEDWAVGYNPLFLDPDLEPVNLPTITPGNRRKIAPLIKQSFYGLKIPTDDEVKSGVLNYKNFSVVVNRLRRIAFYSAANVDGGIEFVNLSRKSDRWLLDKRIARESQIENQFYVRNKIDRGHLTRREDMEWGTDPADATRRANGTCTWTNCSPQHELFNQDKSPDPNIRLWHGLEKYILEQTARQHRFKIQLFTGPIFSPDDPLYRGVRIPLDYWKVVVATDADSKLFATGYILTQRDVLVVKDLDESALVVPFGAFQTYQRPISEIEEATGLRFTYGDNIPLSKIDPLAIELAKPAWKRRRRSSIGLSEYFDTATGSDGALGGFEDIFLG